MKIKLKNISNSYSIIENENGNFISIDNKSVKNPKGVSPMELLLMGVAGCSSIDIISILKKGELPSLFKKIHADVKFVGDIDYNKAFRACKLSFTKYCSVSKTLEATAKITYSVYINEKKVLVK